MTGNAEKIIRFPGSREATLFENGADIAFHESDLPPASEAHAHIAAGVGGIKEEIDTLLAEPTPEKTINLMTWATINNRENKLREYQAGQKAA